MILRESRASIRIWVVAERAPGPAPRRPNRPLLRGPQPSERHAATTSAAIASVEYGSARSRPSIRGSGLARCGASAVRQRRRSNGPQCVPATSRERLRRDPDRRREHGHVAGQRLEHGEPEALALGGDQHRVGGVDPQRHVGRARRRRASAAARRRRPPGAVVALLGPGAGRPGTAGTALAVEPERRRAPRRAGSGGSGRCRRRTGSTATVPPDGPVRDSSRQRLARPLRRGP